jgi:hypothetical protein
MATTQSIRITATSSGNTLTNATSSATLTEQVAIDGYKSFNLQDIDAAREALVIGDVPTAGDYTLTLRNASATANIMIEAYNGTNYVKVAILEPGALFSTVAPANITFHAKASIADGKLEVYASQLGTVLTPTS